MENLRFFFAGFYCTTSWVSGFRFRWKLTPSCLCLVKTRCTEMLHIAFLLKKFKSFAVLILTFVKNKMTDDDLKDRFKRGQTIIRNALFKPFMNGKFSGLTSHLQLSWADSLVFSYRYRASLTGEREGMQDTRSLVLLWWTAHSVPPATLII